MPILGNKTEIWAQACDTSFCLHSALCGVLSRREAGSLLGTWASEEFTRTTRRIHSSANQDGVRGQWGTWNSVPQHPVCGQN